METNTDINGKIKVLLVHDHEILREGLHLLFKSQSDIKVLDEDDGKSVTQLIRELGPDVIVIDINTLGTDKLELSRQISKENPDVRIVAHPERMHMYLLDQAIKAGITGFVLKECSFDELVCAIRTVYAKKTYMCPQIKDILANNYLNQVHLDCHEESSALTGKEYEIIRLLSLGMASKEIAMSMGLSPKTVDAYRRNIMYKLRISNMAELIKHAIREGITSI
jgi:DNA-binding NarL/FixJ family response regulator